VSTQAHKHKPSMHPYIRPAIQLFIQLAAASDKTRPAHQALDYITSQPVSQVSQTSQPAAANRRQQAPQAGRISQSSQHQPATANPSQLLPALASTSQHQTAKAIRETHCCDSIGPKEVRRKGARKRARKMTK
jgi:hypothetical protein